MGNVSVLPMSRKDLRKVAINLRELLGMEGKLYFPV